LTRESSTWRKHLTDHFTQSGVTYLRLARRMLQDHAAAEDACQSAFLKAFTHAEHIEPERLGAWLGRVVSNECLDRLRRKRVRRDHLMHVSHHQQARTQTQAPGGLVEQTEHAHWLLEQLEPELAEVVTLRVMRGCSGQQTAALLQVSPATVSKRLHRAMQQLRTIEQNTQRIGEHR